MFNFGFIFILPMMLLGIGSFILWIWALIDCITKEPSEGNDKIIWILVILLTHFVGALIYIVIRRPKRIDIYGR